MQDALRTIDPGGEDAIVSRYALGFASACLAAITILIWLKWAQAPDALRDFTAMPFHLEQRGLWGDSFGGFTALFTALGFSAVVLTFILQLIQNDAVARDQHIQRFDSSFFELLKLLRELRDECRYVYTNEYLEYYNAKHANAIISGTKKRKSDKSRRGQRSFIAAWKELLWVSSKHANESDGVFKAAVVKYYDDYTHGKFESTFGPYFRLVYTILSRIREDKILSDEQKGLYGNLLRAQVSSFELVMIGINGLSDISKDLDELIEDFHFLKYTPKGPRLEFLNRCYSERAFAGRSER